MCGSFLGNCGVPTELLKAVKVEGENTHHRKQLLLVYSKLTTTHEEDY